MTFLDLAELILKEAYQPLTANEIWLHAVKNGLDQKLDSKGKTPEATLGARLYVNARDNPNSKFKTVGKRPKRFYLTNKSYAVNFEEFEAGKPEEETLLIATPKINAGYLEKHLHAFLSFFAFYHLSCYTKTIQHSTSDKKEYGEWVHPDMVGCVFPIDEWDEEVLELSSVIGKTSVKFISFELKRELNLSTLREKFFQTVSNSSWANESYLVAAEISRNEDFLSESSRLSTSFGIGIIELDIEDPNSSKILFPAKNRPELDWDTINKLTMNKDFKGFLRRVRKDLESKEIRKEQYDKVLKEEELIKTIKAL